MKGDAVAATEDVNCVVFDDREMALHTDDEKVRASIAKDVVPISLKMAVLPTSEPPEDLAKAAERILENGDGKRALAESGRQLTALELQQPLSEEALQKSGVFLAADIPMIDDDDDDEEGTSIDDLAPDNSNDVKNPLNPPSHLSTLSCDDEPSSASCNDVASEDIKAECPSNTDDGHKNDGAAASTSDSRPVIAAPLKSALKKSRNKAKKGHRVTFHDSRIFYIDTEAETTAEPQLLTVRSLELPLASADYKVFIPTYDFLPSLPGRSYTYEDAIVSLQRCDGDAEAPIVCNGETAASKPPEADVTTTKEAAQEPAETLNENDDGAASEETPASPSPLDTALDGGQGVETVQCLTEANLRQHEILMERDDGVATEESGTLAGVVAIPAAAPLVKNLSPPLKELSVDVSVAAAAADGAASWQVELSPLNSIPESETDDSSASSQDTIIMMTSEESRRNEEHIRESTKSYQQQSGKGTTPQEQERYNNNGDAASTASSQDSDETLKCDESMDPGYVPPWTKGTAATLVMDGGAAATKDGDRLSLSRRTNSQIRQLMERNAVRRSLLRYSNTRKRTTTAPQEEAPVAAIDKQRQWRSHESLLDTIKQLTVDDDDEDDDEDDGDYEEIRIHSDGPIPTYGGGAAVTNGYRSLRYSNGTNYSSGLREKTASNLSLQDVQRLIASPPSAVMLQRRRSQSTTAVDVPGDVRQWKIQATRWDEARRRQDGERTSEQAPPPSSAAADETGDELAQFVQRDSGRIERLRKRYSYSDSGDYEAFARRSSVRGIKPRFGSTSEILKQMQSQLQPSPLSNGRSHMTWPYPLTNNENGNGLVARTINGNNNRHTMTIRTTVTSRSTNSLPSLKEEIYGILGAHRSSYAGDARGHPGAIYAPLPGRSHAAPPPPYQPPPPAPQQQQHHNHHQHHHHHHAKGERGVPEGASGSPKVAFDSIYGRTTSSQQRVNGAPPPSLTNAGRHQVPTMTENSGVVYYVMQV